MWLDNMKKKWKRKMRGRIPNEEGERAS